MGPSGVSHHVRIVADQHNMASGAEGKSMKQSQMVDVNPDVVIRIMGKKKEGHEEKHKEHGSHGGKKPSRSGCA